MPRNSAKIFSVPDPRHYSPSDQTLDRYSRQSRTQSWVYTSPNQQIPRKAPPVAPVLTTSNAGDEFEPVGEESAVQAPEDDDDDEEFMCIEPPSPNMEYSLAQNPSKGFVGGFMKGLRKFPGRKKTKGKGKGNVGLYMDEGANGWSSYAARAPALAESIPTNSASKMTGPRPLPQRPRVPENTAAPKTAFDVYASGGMQYREPADIQGGDPPWTARPTLDDSGDATVMAGQYEQAHYDYEGVEYSRYPSVSYQQYDQDSYSQQLSYSHGYDATSHQSRHHRHPSYDSYNGPVSVVHHPQETPSHHTHTPYQSAQDHGQYTDATVEIHNLPDTSTHHRHDQHQVKETHNRMEELDDDDNEGYQFHEEYPSPQQNGDDEDYEYHYDPSFLGPQSYAATPTPAETVHITEGDGDIETRPASTRPSRRASPSVPESEYVGAIPSESDHTHTNHHTHTHDTDTHTTPTYDTRTQEAPTYDTRTYETHDTQTHGTQTNEETRVAPTYDTHSPGHHEVKKYKAQAHRPQPPHNTPITPHSPPHLSFDSKTTTPSPTSAVPKFIKTLSGLPWMSNQRMTADYIPAIPGRVIPPDSERDRIPQRTRAYTYFGTPRQELSRLAVDLDVSRSTLRLKTKASWYHRVDSPNASPTSPSSPKHGGDRSSKSSSTSSPRRRHTHVAYPQSPDDEYTRVEPRYSPVRRSFEGGGVRAVHDRESSSSGSQSYSSPSPHRLREQDLLQHSTPKAKSPEADHDAHRHQEHRRRGSGDSSVAYFPHPSRGFGPTQNFIPQGYSLYPNPATPYGVVGPGPMPLQQLQGMPMNIPMSMPVQQIQPMQMQMQMPAQQAQPIYLIAAQPQPQAANGQEGDRNGGASPEIRQATQMYFVAQNPVPGGLLFAQPMIPA